MASCPVDHAAPPMADQRRSAAAVRDDVPATATRLTAFDAVRALLRDPAARQAGFKAEMVERFGRPDRAPILYLAGEAHRRQRGAVARFFAPRVVTTRYRGLIEAVADREIARFRAAGSGSLDAMTLTLAVEVAAEIVGLTESDRRGMARRLDAFLSVPRRGDPLSLFAGFVMGRVRMWRFHRADVRPAIAARRRAPREDVISHLLADGYADRQILVECFTYGAAGMVTTREFITMAGWHLMEDAEARGRFLAGDEAARIAILEEILRLEPVVGMLYRRGGADGALVALDVRRANLDEAAVGACPLALRPGRALADRVGGAGLAFGDGEHRCPGAGVAMHEAAIFLDRLLRVPGLRLERAPDVGWNAPIAGYELRGCRLSCAVA